MFLGAEPHTFENAKELRRGLTPAEKILWGRLRKKRLGFNFRRQHPIADFILDFYCHEVCLAIEVDGEVHTSVNQKEYDEHRTLLLNEMGIDVMRFSNEDVFKQTDEVCSIIQTKANELR